LLSYFQIANEKDLKAFIEKTRTVPVIFSKENRQPILLPNTRIEPVSSIEKEQGYLLSKKDFEIHFA
jgi:hypothetical protein